MRPLSLDEKRIICWSSATGKKPVKEWLASLDNLSFKKVDKLLGLLRVLGRDLKLPHCRFLGDDLYELRDTSTGPGFRIYYTWKDDLLIILLMAGDKSSQEQDIKTARKRLNDEE